MSRGNRLHSWLNFSHALKTGLLELRYGFAADVQDPALASQSPQSIINQAKMYDNFGEAALNPKLARPRLQKDELDDGD
jgi:hypothetical protein